MIVDAELLVLILIIAAGGYIQAVTGFGLGLVAVGAVAVSGVASVSLIAAVVSIATFFNTAVALRGQLHLVNRRDAGMMLAGMLPAVLAGVLLLEFLSASLTAALHSTLAVSILAGGVLLMLAPDPRPSPAGGWLSLLMGAIGGLLTGLFATGGPPIIYHMYRQPYEVAMVRATLLATFAVACIVRITHLGVQGSLSGEVLELAMASVPAIIAATLIGYRYPLPLSERNTRRVAFCLLTALGTILLAVGG